MVERDTASLCHALARVWVPSRRSAVVVTAVLGLLSAGLLPAATAQARGCADAHTRIADASRRALQHAVVCLINRQRARHHLPRLHASRRLNRSAQGWTNTMVREGSFGHGSDFASRITAVGFHWSMAGENIATGFVTPAAVVRAWMASAGHCENILSPSFADVGTGVSRRGIAGAGSYGTWTQDFALPMGHRPPSGNSGPASGCPY
jgi:uncharacterized protein YkwD